MTGTVGDSKYDNILLPAEKVKIATNNVFWNIEDKAVRKAFPDKQIIRQKSILDMFCIIIAAFNLFYSFFYLIIADPYHLLHLRCNNSQFS
jgi:hypothetical protein